MGESTRGPGDGPGVLLDVGRGGRLNGRESERCENGGVSRLVRHGGVRRLVFLRQGRDVEARPDARRADVGRLRRPHRRLARHRRQRARLRGRGVDDGPARAVAGRAGAGVVSAFRRTCLGPAKAGHYDRLIDASL